MKTLIVYYSRTGHTRTVAAALAEALHADVEQITEPRGRRGILGYLRSGRDLGATVRRPAVQSVDLDLNAGELLVADYHLLSRMPIQYAT